MKRFLALALLALVVVGGLYLWFVAKWSYSSGERAGWVQKFSRKGWVCKTWEGELAMVSMPGTTPEKFYFTVWDDAVAARINQVMGQRVSLHYEQKSGLPGSCFGETPYWVDKVEAVPEIPQLSVPPVQVPAPPAPVAPQPEAQPPPAVTK